MPGIPARALLVSIALFALSWQAVYAADRATAFVHVSVIPMDRERILRDWTVVVIGDRIRDLGPATVVSPDGTERHVELSDLGCV